MLDEQRRDVPLPVHHRHHADAAGPPLDGVGLPGQKGAVAPAPEPAPRLPLLRRLAALAAAFGTVELNARNPERDALLADRERAVHVDAEGARALPAVPCDHPQPVAAGMGREVEVGPVLDQQHRPSAPHATHRPIPVTRQDALRRQTDMLVVRFPDHPVIPRHQGLIAAGRREERLRGRRRLHRGAGHEPVPQLPVQRGPAKLIPRPPVPVKAVAGAENGAPARRRIGGRADDPERAAPAGRQRAQPHRLGRDPLPRPRPPPASGALADIGPSRRAQAAAAVAFPHEGLHKQGQDTVASEKVGPEPPQAQRKRLRGQVPAADAPPDQEPRHADDPVKPRRTARRVPADPVVPGGQPRRRTGENETPEQAVVRTQQIAQLPACVLRRAERMVVRKHPRQKPALRIPADRPHLQSDDVVHTRRHANRFRDRRQLHPRRPRHPLAGTLRRKSEPALRLKRRQRRQRRHAPR